MLKVPEWLNEKFIFEVLKDNDESYKKKSIIKLTVSPGTERATNYSSTIYKLEAEVGSCEQSNSSSVTIIVKVPLEKVTTSLHSHERYVYENIISETEQLTTNENVCPKFYYTYKPCIVILEDLTLRGYRSFEKGKLLDYEHSVLAVSWLGKFHAVSIALHNDEPETVETAGENYMFTAQKQRRLEALFMGSVYSLAEEVKTWPECAKYSGKIQNIGNILWEKLDEISIDKSDSFNVLNHGDCWAGNMMFHYDDRGKVDSVIFVDYQMTRYCTCGLDLQYFLANTDEDVRYKRIHDILQTYLETLNTYLEKLHCHQKLTKEKLYEEMKRAEYIGFYANCNFPLMCLTPKENSIDKCDFDITEIKTVKQYPLKKLLKGEAFRKFMPNVLDHYHSIGLL